MRGLILLAVLAQAPLIRPLPAQDMVPKVLTSELDRPWEISWGADAQLWVTERTTGRILRIDPDMGEVQVAGIVPDVVAPGWQDGLLGIGRDPAFLTGAPYLYAAHTYLDMTLPADPAVPDPANPYAHLHTRIIRLTWDPATSTLNDPKVLIHGLPAGPDHNSGRLQVGPDGMLYYTIGDMGHNQLANWCRPIEAQRLPKAEELAAGDLTAYVGKVLRIAPDGSVPADNPVLGGVQSHVFTYGHRNPQGLVFGPDGTLYSSEHGPKTDDEVNLLRAGGNYGWPHVAGYRDDMAYQYARWAEASVPCASLTFSDITIDPSVPVTDETAWTEPMVDPLATLFTVPSDYNFQDPACGGVDYICWPTVAPSAIEIYPKGLKGWPGMENSLLVTTLKRGSLYRIPLTTDGQAAAGPPERLWRTDNRYRDLTISPDGKRIFVITDVGGQHDTAEGGVSDQVANPGAILVFSAP